MKRLFSIALCALSISFSSIHAMDRSYTEQQLWDYLNFGDLGTMQLGSVYLSGPKITGGPGIFPSFWYSRAYVFQPLTSNQYFDDIKFIWTPFTFWISSDDSEGKQIIQDNGLKHLATETMMYMDRPEDWGTVEPGRGMTIEFFLFGDTAKVKEWIATSAQGFDLPEQDVTTFMRYIQNQGFDDNCFVNLWMVRVNEKPVCTAMQVFHTDTMICTLHQLSTVKEYRRQGAATLLILNAQDYAWKTGFKSFWLCASAMAYPLFKQLTFKDYKKVDVYSWTGSSAYSEFTHEKAYELLKRHGIKTYTKEHVDQWVAQVNKTDLQHQ